jgi:hypothetical protein
MLKVCCQNQLKWRYALADSWFSSSENMKYIHATLEKQFIFALKSNRMKDLYFPPFLVDCFKGGCRCA